MKRESMILGLAVLTVAALGPIRATAIGPDGPSWEPRETITENGGFGIEPENQYMAFDHHGNVGVAFGTNEPDGAIRYAERMPGVGWHHWVVDDAVDPYDMSLAYDRHERPAIAYDDNAEGYLHYAWYDGHDWQTTIADDRCDGGPSLAFDAYGRPAIAYNCYDDGTLNFAWDIDGTGVFSTEEVATGDTADPSLVYDGQNRPMIAYLNTEGVNFAIRGSGGWATSVIEALEMWARVSLAVDPNSGHPVIAYVHDQVEGGCPLKLAEWNGNEWEVTNLGVYLHDTFVAVSLAFDPADGNPAIAYRDDGNVGFAWFDGAVWQEQIVDEPPGWGENVCLAFNDWGDGWPSIAYNIDDVLYFVHDPPAAPEPAAVVLLLLGSGAVVLRRHLRGE